MLDGHIKFALRAIFKNSTSCYTTATKVTAFWLPGRVKLMTRDNGSLKTSALPPKATNINF
jgi:hypothetical protein